MKTLFKDFMLLTAVAVAFAACSQDELNTIDLNSPVTLKFNITKAAEIIDNKALLGTENGKNFLDWEDGDKIGTFSVGSFGDNTVSNNNAGTVEVSGDEYTLNVQAFNAGSITNIYSYYPYSSSAGKDKTAAIVTIPESQFMNASGFDADAMPMAGAPVTVDLSVVANTDTPCGTINFSNLGSIINFKIYSSTSTDETLTSVKYVTSGNVAGAFSIDLTGIDASSESSLALTASDPVAEVTTTYTTHPTIPQGKANALDVYMVVAPGTYANTQVVVTTSARTYTLTASSEKSYARSHVKPMNVDIQNGTSGELPLDETWTKVTSSADFTAGTYYILRADGAYYVPNSTGNPSCVAFSAAGVITNAMKWTATASGSGLVFESVLNPGNYLWTTNTGSANTISVTATSTGTKASKVWSFASVTKDDVTYYTATAGASKYLVSYGTSNWRYYANTNISSSNIPAEFYKLETSATPEVTWNLESISVTNAPTKTTYTAGESFDPAGMVVTGHFVDADDATNTKDEAVTGYTITPSGALATTDTQVTITYQSKTATQNITVNEAAAGNDGSLEHPYTASEARALALNGDTGSYYISGIVTKIQNQYSASYGTANFWIDENGSDQTVFEGYKIKYFGNVNWVEGNAEIALNDEVVIYGTLTVYNTTTPETSSGYLVSLNGKTKGLTLAAPTVTTNASAKQITVAWTAATGSESAVSYVINCGTQSYNASAAGSHTFTMADYGTYKVSVVASADDAVSAAVSTTATISDPGSSAPDPETVDFSAQDYSNQQEISSYNGENFTITFNKGSNSNAPKYYTSGAAIRAYGGNTFTVSSANYKISGIVITFGSGDGSNAITTNVETYSDGIWSGSSQSVKFTIGGTTGNRRIQKIEVTYE